MTDNTPLMRSIMGNYVDDYNKDSDYEKDPIVMFGMPELTGAQFFNYLWALCHPNERFVCEREKADKLVADMAAFLCADAYCKYTIKNNEGENVLMSVSLAQRIRDTFDETEYLRHPIELPELDHDPNADLYYFELDDDLLSEHLQDTVMFAIHHCAVFDRDRNFTHRPVMDNGQRCLTFNDDGWDTMKDYIEYSLKALINAIEDGPFRVEMVPAAFSRGNAKRARDSRRVEIKDFIAGNAKIKENTPAMIVFGDHKPAEKHMAFRICDMLGAIPDETEEIAYISYDAFESSHLDLLEGIKINKLSVIMIDTHDCLRPIFDAPEWEETLTGALRLGEKVGSKEDSLGIVASDWTKWWECENADIPSTAFDTVSTYAAYEVARKFVSDINDVVDESRPTFKETEICSLISDMSFGKIEIDHLEKPAKDKDLAGLYAFVISTASSGVMHPHLKTAYTINGLRDIYRSAGILNNGKMRVKTLNELLKKAEEAGVCEMVRAYVEGVSAADIIS